MVRMFLGVLLMSAGCGEADPPAPTRKPNGSVQTSGDTQRQKETVVSVQQESGFPVPKGAKLLTRIQNPKMYAASFEVSLSEAEAFAFLKKEMPKAGFEVVKKRPSEPDLKRLKYSKGNDLIIAWVRKREEMTHIEYNRHPNQK